MATELQLPIWAQYLQAFLTPAIAMLALTIAYGQWRLAQQKIVLELFEKRYASFEQIRKAVARLLVYGTAKQEDVTEYLAAMDSAQFLFGEDVRNYLKELNAAINRLHDIETAPDRPNDQAKRERETTEYVGLRATLLGFYDVYPKLMRTYMLMDHKLASTTDHFRVLPYREK